MDASARPLACGRHGVVPAASPRKPSAAFPNLRPGGSDRAATAEKTLLVDPEVLPQLAHQLLESLDRRLHRRWAGHIDAG